MTSQTERRKRKKLKLLAISNTFLFKYISIFCPTAVRRLSDGRPTAVRRSDGRRTAVGWPSDGRRTDRKILDGRKKKLTPKKKCGFFSRKKCFSQFSAHFGGARLGLTSKSDSSRFFALDCQIFRSIRRVECFFSLFPFFFLCVSP